MNASTSYLMDPNEAEGEAELVAEGWTRRFVGGPRRLSEIKELYESLGYEVRLEPQSPEEFHDECHDCVLALKLFRVVYTRKATNQGHK